MRLIWLCALCAAFVAGCGDGATEIDPGNSAGGTGTESTTGTETATASMTGTDSQGSDSMSGTTDSTTDSASASMTGMTQGSESESESAGTDSGGTDGTDGGTSLGVTDSDSDSDSDGSTSTTGMMACNQVDMGNEPGNNDQQDAPGSLPDADCGPATNFQGTLDGSTDDDWFGLTVIWNGTCISEDSARMIVDVGGGLEVCAYHQCLGLADEYQCSNGATQDTAPNGDLGCCGTDATTIDWECNNSVNGALMYIVVNGANGDECVNYSGTYDVNAGSFIPD